MEASAPCIREGGDQIGHWLGGGSGPLGLATADQEFSLIKYFTFRCRSLRFQGTDVKLMVQNSVCHMPQTVFYEKSKRGWRRKKGHSQQALLVLDGCCWEQSSGKLLRN